MAVGFDGVLFSVLAPDGRFPEPADDESGMTRYRPTVRATAATLASLRSRRSKITEKPAHGFASGGDVVVNGGPGALTLILPSAEGGERTFAAVLKAVTPLAFLTDDTAYQVELDFLCLDEDLS
jgi:hypothetical protein